MDDFEMNFRKIACTILNLFASLFLGIACIFGIGCNFIQNISDMIWPWSEKNTTVENKSESVEE